MNEDDLRIAWSKDHGQIGNIDYKFFKWDSNLGKKDESPIIAKWIRLPELPPDLFVKLIFTLIGISISTFVTADPETINTNRPAHPRICVEVNMTKPLPTKVYVQIGDDEGYWQPIAFEGTPAYCVFSKMRGHSIELRRKKVYVDAKRNRPQAFLQTGGTVTILNAQPQMQKKKLWMQKKDALIVTSNQFAALDALVVAAETATTLDAVTALDGTAFSASAAVEVTATSPLHDAVSGPAATGLQALQTHKNYLCLL